MIRLRRNDIYGRRPNVLAILKHFLPRPGRRCRLSACMTTATVLSPPRIDKKAIAGDNRRRRARRHRHREMKSSHKPDVGWATFIRRSQAGDTMPACADWHRGAPAAYLLTRRRDSSFSDASPSAPRQRHQAYGAQNSRRLRLADKRSMAASPAILFTIDINYHREDCLISRLIIKHKCHWPAKRRMMKPFRQKPHARTADSEGESAHDASLALLPVVA